MNKNIHYDVILTSEARKIIAEEPISRLLKNGRYFNCIEINTNPQYLFMKIEDEDEDIGKFIREVQIPHYFVLYIVSADSTKSLGF